MRDERDLRESESANALDDTIVVLPDRFGLELDDRCLGCTDRSDLLTFGVADDCQHLGVCFGIDGLGLGFTGCPLDHCLRIELGDLDGTFGCHHTGLGVGLSGRLLELLAGLLCKTLRVVRRLFLLGQLAVGQGLHQFGRRNYVADERLYRDHIVFGQCCRDGGLGFCLPHGTVFEEVDDVRVLRRIAEVVADGRLEHLRDERFHTAKPSDHLRRRVARDVDDLAHVQVECEAVGRTHRDS